MFVGLGKSPQTIRREIQTKRLLELVRGSGAEGRWRANRHAGIISDGNKLVIRVVVGATAEDPTILEWKYRAATDAQLDKDSIK
eukprot:3538283-Pyramimonas_sp.AAC.1